MALCNPKTLRGIHAVGRQLGLDIEDMRAMTTTGRLSKIKESEAASLLSKLRAQLQDGKKKPQRIFRLYMGSELAKWILYYKNLITWHTPDGFTRWLLKHFKVERLEWVDSKQKAINIKNALKRMSNEEQAGCRKSS